MCRPLLGRLGGADETAGGAGARVAVGEARDDGPYTAPEWLARW